jgi:hypothetical protein
MSPKIQVSVRRLVRTLQLRTDRWDTRLLGDRRNASAQL